MKAAISPHKAAFLGFTGPMPTPRPVTASAAPAGSAVPILPSADLDHALACYRYLGFELLGRTADYVRLALGAVELHLYLDPGLDALRNSAGCYLRVSDPAALRAAWSIDGVNCLDVTGTAAYGTSLFAVIDSDGNTLRIGPLDHVDEPRA